MSLILDGTNGLSDVDGTAATPAIRGTDTNTGIFFPAADTIAFSEGGTESARFDSSGNLGLGTTTPNSKLTSQTATSSTSAFTFANQLNNSFGSNESIVAMGFHNRADVNSNGVGAAIALSGGGVSAGSGNLVFCIKGTGNIAATVAPSDEKMRIDSSGTLIVNSTSKQNGDVKFSVTGNNGGAMETKFTADYYPLLIYRSGNLYGSIYQSGTSTAYNTGSDYRLKENIVDLPNALQTLSQLKPRQFDWKETGNTTTGFIAHELAEVLPQAVTGEKDAVDKDGKPTYQGIDTSFLVATLTAAIQEQQSLIENLTNRLTALEGN
jgi:hypothetical protein